MKNKPNMDLPHVWFMYGSHGATSKNKRIQVASFRILPEEWKLLCISSRGNLKQGIDYPKEERTEKPIGDREAAPGKSNSRKSLQP